MSLPTECPANSLRRVSALFRQIALLLCVTITAASCASSSSLKNAYLAESQQDFDRAVVEYTKAAREHPNDRNIHESLEQAKLRAAQDHFTRARRMSSVGKLEEA